MVAVVLTIGFLLITKGFPAKSPQAKVDATAAGPLFALKPLASALDRCTPQSPCNRGGPWRTGAPAR
jgi:hypothetical protein